MDRLEMSQRFDVMFNNLTSNQAPGLNEYEKSVFLTKAQDQLVNEYFNIRTDGAGGGYDGNQKRQYDFSSLVKVATLDSANIADTEKLDKRSKVFLFPSDYFLAVNELISDDRYQYNVIPLSYGEYSRLMMKPYAYPVKKGAWRLFTNKKPGLNSTKINHSSLVIEGKEYIINTFWVGYPLQLNFSTVKSIITPWAGTGFSSETTYIEEDDVTVYTIKYSYSKDTSVKCYLSVYSDQCIVEDGIQKITLDFGTTDNDANDETLFSYIQDGFNQLDSYILNGGQSTIIYTIGTYLNNLKYIDIPKAKNLRRIQGTTFNFEILNQEGIMAEVIGRFVGEVNYQLRYIKEPAPIILEDLGSDEYTDVKIKGKTEASDCELPEEMHEEILERAVTLAKIAWQGGTATQVAAAQQNNRNND